MSSCSEFSCLLIPRRILDKCADHVLKLALLRAGDAGKLLVTVGPCRCKPWGSSLGALSCTSSLPSSDTSSGARQAPKWLCVEFKEENAVETDCVVAKRIVVPIRPRSRNRNTRENLRACCSKRVEFIDPQVTGALFTSSQTCTETGTTSISGCTVSAGTITRARQVVLDVVLTSRVDDRIADAVCLEVVCWLYSTALQELEECSEGEREGESALHFRLDDQLAAGDCRRTRKNSPCARLHCSCPRRVP